MNVSYGDLIRLEQKQIPQCNVAYLPSKAVISLCQDGNIVMESLVKKGDSVFEGQIIARKIAGIHNFCSNPNYINQIKYPAYINSPIPGIVEDVVDFSTPDGKRNKSVIINMSGKFSFTGKNSSIAEYKKTTASQLINKLSEMGVLNTFDKPLSLAQQVSDNLNTENLVIAVRLFDSDPENIIESYLSRNFIAEIVSGCRIIADVLNCTHVVLVGNDIPIPENLNTEEKYTTDIVEHKSDCFPNGTEKYLCSISGEYIFNKYRTQPKNFLVLDSQTCIDIFNAIVKSYPVMDRFIQVYGDVINETKILRVKIGTSFKNIFSECDGFSEMPYKIIVNGFIKGVAVSDLDCPVTRNVKSIGVISRRGFPDKKNEVCIRCGKCHIICPEKLQPEKIYSYFTEGNPVRQVILDSIKLCTECGLCNTICPSRIPLYQTMQIVKDKQNEKNI